MAAQDHTVVLDSMSVDSCSPWEEGQPKVSSFQIHNLVYLEVHSGAVESKGRITVKWSFVLVRLQQTRFSRSVTDKNQIRCREKHPL